MSGTSSSGPNGEAAPRNGNTLEHDALVLVVDDNHDLRESMKVILEIHGYCVMSAANGAEAIALLNQIPRPAAAIVDLCMPIMDGVQLIHALRADSRFAKLPIIAFSAATNIEPPAGVPLLKKPVALEQLFSKLRAAMHVSGSS